MSLNCSYKDIEWCQSLFHKSDECFSDGNLIVPDSMDDIAKIISVKSTASVSDSKTEVGRIIVNGQVKINVLYIGENESSKICTLTASVPFSHIINAEDITDEFISIVNVTCCSSNYTLVNSRRLKVSSLIKFCASSYKNNRLKLLCKADGAQVKTKELSYAAARVICKKNIVISEVGELPSGKGAISKILRQSAKITDKDFKILNNKAIIKGNITLSLLYLCDDEITDAAISIPFTEVVEAEGLSPSYDTTVSITVADCEIQPDTDLSGDYRMIDSSVILSVTILSFTKETVNTIEDVYLPGGSVKVENATISIKEIPKEYHEEEFIKEIVNLPKGVDMSRVIDADCHLTDLSLSDDVINSIAEVNFVYISSDSSNPVNTYSTKIPLTHKLSLKNSQNPRCEIKHMSYAISGNDSVDVRFNVDFSAQENNGASHKVFTCCEQTEYTPEKRPSIIVSFVNENDTLWDIAKKYNISLSHLASANAIDENQVLTIGEKLIIPR